VIVVEAFDKGVQPLTSNITVTFNIVKSYIKIAYEDIQISEDTSISTVITVINATDPVTGQLMWARYRLIGQH
jgi:hypothetical protein